MTNKNEPITCYLCGSEFAKGHGRRCIDCDAMRSFYRRVMKLSREKRMDLYGKHIQAVQRLVNVMDNPNASDLKLCNIELETKRGRDAA